MLGAIRALISVYKILEVSFVYILEVCGHKFHIRPIFWNFFYGCYIKLLCWNFQEKYFLHLPILFRLNLFVLIAFMDDSNSWF